MTKIRKKNLSYFKLASLISQKLKIFNIISFKKWGGKRRNLFIYFFKLSWGHLLKDGHPILSHSYFTFRWGYPMICTISSTICGLKTSLLESFLDKHMPWISGQPNQHHPVITRRIMQMQPMAPIPTATKTMSFNVSPDIDEKKT